MSSQDPVGPKRLLPGTNISRGKPSVGFGIPVSNWLWRSLSSVFCLRRLPWKRREKRGCRDMNVLIDTGVFPLVGANAVQSISHKYWRLISSKDLVLPERASILPSSIALMSSLERRSRVT